MAQNISVPDIGDFKDVEVIEVLVKPGDQINKNDPIVTIESDKSSVEIPSPESGQIKDLKVKIGDKVSKGSILATIQSEIITPDPHEKRIVEPQKKIPVIEKSKSNPGYFKYMITIKEKDGRVHEEPAYGYDMQDAIRRLVRAENADMIVKVVEKKQSFFTLALFACCITLPLIGGLYTKENFWVIFFCKKDSFLLL